MGSLLPISSLILGLSHAARLPSLLSCDFSKPWLQFRQHLWDVSEGDRTPCGLKGDGDKGRERLVARTFARALGFYDFFAPQTFATFRHSDLGFLLCEMQQSTLADGSHSIVLPPLPDAGERFAEVLTNGGGGFSFPCVFGFLAASTCVLQVEQDVLAGRWVDFLGSARGAFEDTGYDILARSGIFDHLETGKSTPAFDEVRDLLQRIMLRPSMMFLLAASSAWPIRLEHVLAVLPNPAGTLTEVEVGKAHGFVANIVNLQPWGLKIATKPIVAPLRIWGISLHQALLHEVIDIWTRLDAAHNLFVHIVALCSGCSLRGRAHQYTYDGKSPLKEFIEQGLDKKVTAMKSSGRFPLIRNVEDFSSGFVRLAHGEGPMLEADILFCGEPAYFCWLLMEIGHAPVVGYLGTMLGSYLPKEAQRRFYSNLLAASLEPKPRLRLCAMAPPLSAQAFWQSGVTIPVVRPLGRYTDAMYRPDRLDVLVTKQIYYFWDFVCLFAEAAGGASWSFVQIGTLQDRSWQTWARHRAIVYLPYEPFLMTFYEMYSMAIPMLLPTRQLLPLLFVGGYFSVLDLDVRSPGAPSLADGAAWGGWNLKQSSGNGTFTELSWWAELSDMTSLPHLLRWHSIAELLEHLSPGRHTELVLTSDEMRRESDRWLLRSADYWHATLSSAVD